MGNPIATKISSTTHNGTPTSWASKTIAAGNLVLRVGDTIVCPVIGHGTTTITGGSSNSIVEGKAIARNGDPTSCGATLTNGVTTVPVGG